MTVYAVSRNSQSWYGEQIGILILDAAYPCVPGNVGNATTYTYPVRYQEVRGASIDRLLNQRDPALKEAFVEAALELQGRGVKAITGACGFMAYFQEEVAEAVDIPVFLSSLMQIPFMHAVARGGTVGVITANAERLSPRHFAASGIPETIPIVLAGMEDQAEFREAILEEKGTLDSRRHRARSLRSGDEARAGQSRGSLHPARMQRSSPYAHAVQKVTGRPVFDFISMINYVQQTVACRAYHGFM
ncbi:aspartate/glutamate racemase family protein [Ochrobactrum intermedium]|nr:aspartate/glutamate racemase family protein [Brucella intermedia]